MHSAVTEGTWPVLLCPHLPLHHTHLRKAVSTPWVTKSGWEMGRDFARFLSPALSLI